MAILKLKQNFEAGLHLFEMPPSPSPFSSLKNYKFFNPHYNIITKALALFLEPLVYWHNLLMPPALEYKFANAYDDYYISM